MTYPEHIYDPQRREMAEELLAKELSKLLPTLPPSDLRSTIAQWQTSPSQYHLEDDIRDFWDIFAAVFEQIKLKPGFTHLFTAANVSWTREHLPVHSIQLSSPLDQLHHIPNLLVRPLIPVSEVVAAASAAGVIDDQKAINDSHSTDPAQDDYPIIAKRMHDGSVRVYDGNRRSLRAGLYGRETIDAWVGELHGNTPRDFWVPVGEMYQLVRYYQLATTDAQRQAARNMLENLFTLSSVAKISYTTRIKNESAVTAEFLAMQPTL